MFLKLLEAKPNLLKASTGRHRVITTHQGRRASETELVSQASGTPWVAPSLLRTRRESSLPVWITRVAKWQQQLKTCRHPDACSWRAVQSVNILLPSLSALRASTNRKPHCSSLWECSCQRSLAACMPPSTPALRPAHDWSTPRASFASSPQTSRAHFQPGLSGVSLMPTGRTPGILPIPTSRPAWRARRAGQGGLSFGLLSC